jgi:hypothetical protein
MEPNNPNQQKSNMPEELLSFLVDICEKNPNDQVLGFKLRFFIKCLNEGVEVDPHQINFVN